jgi:uncharacterized protein YodC (DUF2158 family)
MKTDLNFRIKELVKNIIIDELDAIAEKLKNNYSAKYNELKKHSEKWENDKIEQCRKTLKSSGLSDIITQAAESEKKNLIAKMKPKSYTIVHFVSVSEGNPTFFVPGWGQRDAEGSLEYDLFKCALESAENRTRGFYFIDHKIGKHSALVGPFIKNDDKTEWAIADYVRRMTDNFPVNARLLGLGIDTYVVNGNFSFVDTEEGDTASVRVKITPSSIKYKLIPLYRKNCDFFPDVDQKFQIVIPSGTVLPVHVTSETEMSGKGNYICSNGQGQMRAAFEEMKLKPGDSVEIAELERRKKYSMKKV